MRFIFCVITAFFLFCSCAHNDKKIIQRSSQNAEAILKPFIDNDSAIRKLVNDSVAYVIYPRVGKAAIGIGGAHGNGEVYEKKFGIYHLVGKSELTQINIGLQLGAKTFTEVIFFEDDYTFKRFKKGELEVNAEASAVALTSGASAKAMRTDGITIVILNAEGLMGELSVGGQKLSYQAF